MADHHVHGHRATAAAAAAAPTMLPRINPHPQRQATRNQDSPTAAALGRRIPTGRESWNRRDRKHDLRSKQRLGKREKTAYLGRSYIVHAFHLTRTYAMKYLGPPASGSMNATCASRNRFGQYLRTRAIPVQPRTPAQLNQRARMSTNAAAWRALTDNQRAGWLDLGLLIIRTDSLGQSYDLNGFGAYCSVNNNRLDAGDAAVADAPGISTPAGLITATITLTAAAMSVAYTATPLAAANRLYLFVSPGKSAGRKFNGDYRLIAVTAAAAASPANIFAAYSARFGVPIVGTRIFFSLATYTLGFKGSPFAVSQVVA